VADNSPYTVSISTQPSSPIQSCTVTNSVGTVSGTNVTNMAIICTVDHNKVLGSCYSCHNGTLVPGKTAAHPIETTNECDACHLNTSSFVPVPSVDVDHGEIINGDIDCTRAGCHGETKSASHIATTNDCGACHKAENFVMVAATDVDHNEVLGSCFSCHNGISVPGKTAAHPINMTDTCDACHQPGPAAWTPVAAQSVDHIEIINVDSCIACHNGAVASGTAGIHTDANFQTSDNCGACHTVGSAWMPVASNDVDTKFAPVLQVDHNEINLTGGCIQCHDGTTAIGKDADHANTSNTCDACHNTNAFIPVANVDHGEVIGTCSACHNGVIAKGQGSRHFVYTGLECDACHNETRWSISSTYAHGLAGVDEYLRPDHRFGNINCRTCHTGSTSTIPAGLALCARCHENDYEPGPHRNVSVSSLQDCSGACHRPDPVHRTNDIVW